MLNNWFFRSAFSALPIIMALTVTTILLAVMGVSPAEAYRNIFLGAFERPEKLAEVLFALVPLVLCSAGLLLTFSAGLWNIGIEGQIVFGAISTTFAVRTFDLPLPILLPLLILAGAVGGGFWGWVVGVLKTSGRVNEIFAGLGLNFIALSFANYLILGPWQRAGIASTSGTELFRPVVWLPTFSDFAFGPVELFLAVFASAGVYFFLRQTRVGLELKAVGQSLKASFLLGIPVDSRLLLALIICGMLAGLSGAVQVLGLYHRLTPSISSGYGYLAILVVMLSGMRVSGIIPIAFFFAAVNKGSLQLPLQLQIDSSLGGFLQSVLVLFVLLIKGLEERFAFWERR